MKGDEERHDEEENSVVGRGRRVKILVLMLVSENLEVGSGYGGWVGIKDRSPLGVSFLGWGARTLGHDRPPSSPSIRPGRYRLRRGLRLASPCFRHEDRRLPPRPVGYSGGGGHGGVRPVFPHFMSFIAISRGTGIDNWANCCGAKEILVLERGLLADGHVTSYLK